MGRPKTIIVVFLVAGPILYWVIAAIVYVFAQFAGIFGVPIRTAWKSIEFLFIVIAVGYPILAILIPLVVLTFATLSLVSARRKKCSAVSTMRTAAFGGALTFAACFSLEFFMRALMLRSGPTAADLTLLPPVLGSLFAAMPMAITCGLLARLTRRWQGQRVEERVGWVKA